MAAGQGSVKEAMSKLESFSCWGIGFAGAGTIPINFLKVPHRAAER